MSNLIFYLHVEHKEVLPWIGKAIGALRDVGLIPDAKTITGWDVAKELSLLEVYQPVANLLHSIAEIGTHLGELKAKTSTDAGKLHHAIHSILKDAIQSFKALNG